MPATLEGRARTVLAAVVVALILIVPLVLLFAGSGGDDEDPASSGGLRIERSGGQLIVYVDPAYNTPARTGGARRVILRCLDGGDRIVISQDEAWPFTDTDAGTLDPHAHVTLDPGTLDAVRNCHVLGTEPRLEGAAP
jgi:hypothetical protein